MKLINVIKSESYKILIKHKVLFIFLLVLVINVFTFYRTSNEKQITFENYKAQEIYEEEMAFLEGPYTKEKDTYIVEKSTQYREIVIKLESLFNNPKELLEVSRDYPNAFEYDMVFQVFKYQNDYVKENIAQRFFIDATPWSYIMQYQSPEYLTIIAILFVVAYVTVVEYSSNMDVLNRSTYLGRQKRAIIQMSILTLSGFLLIALERIAKLVMLYDSLKSSMMFPIQSLSYYANALVNTNIIGVYLILIGMSFVGVLLLVLIVNFLTHIFRNVAMSFFGGFIIILSPFLVSLGPDIIYYPYPVNWFLGSMMLRGSEAINIGAAFPIYESNDFIIFCTVSCVIAIALYFLNRRFSKRGELL